MPRGRPSSYVRCEACGGSMGLPHTHICRSCVPTNRKWKWDEAKDRLVREAWASGTDKRKLTAAITNAVRIIGYPRYIVRLRAQYLGVAQDERRHWTAEEIEFLQENAGDLSAKKMAKRLKVSHSKVVAMLGRLKLTRRIMSGYSATDVAALLGVSLDTVAKWERLRLLSRHEGRIPECDVRNLIFQHPELYSLRKVDEVLFKALVFESAACYRKPTETRKRNSTSLFYPVVEQAVV